MRCLKVGLTTLAVLWASTCLAQDARVRSSDFTPAPSPDGTAKIECIEWNVGFEYLSCERVPFPGQESEFAQLYKKKDGTSVSLLREPDLSGVDKSGQDVSVSTDTPIDGQGASSTRPAVLPTAVPAPTTVPEVQPAPMAEYSAPERLPGVIPSIPGRSELLPVAIGHLNRIETPFADPAIQTSADESTINFQFDQNFVYVSVTQPATIYIHEKGFPDPVIALSLIPQKIAPRQVNMTLTPSALKQAQAHAATAARASEARVAPQLNRPSGQRASAQSSYEDGIVGIMAQFGRGEIPSGFQKGSISKYDIRQFCRRSGVSFSFSNGQTYYSRDYIVLIGRASSNSSVDLQEAWCAAQPATVAVSFVQRTRLSRGKPTEFMILLKRDQDTRGGSATRKRIVSQ